jgi:predicted RNase H-like nuclease (RuvC/YqgF family)
LEVYALCLHDGIVGALALNSKKRLNEAVEIFRKEMSMHWRNDQQIKQIVEQYPSLLREAR